MKAPTRPALKCYHFRYGDNDNGSDKGGMRYDYNDDDYDGEW